MSSRISLAAIISAAFVVTLPVSAHAQRCNIAGTWRINQQNGIATATMHQNGSTLFGTAIYRSQSGTINGQINGRQVLFTVRWAPNSTGEYNGILQPNGRLEGRTRDLRNPQSQSNWWASRRFRC